MMPGQPSTMPADKQMQKLPRQSALGVDVSDGAIKPLAAALLAVIQRVGFGTIIIDARGHVLDINNVARDLLNRHFGLNTRQCDSYWLRDCVCRLTDRVASNLPGDIESWVTIPCEVDRPLALHRIPIADAYGSINTTLIILIDFNDSSRPNQTTLHRLFGLTSAEARLASQVTRGGTAVRMACDTRLSIATIRSQLASIFQKTNTRRQSELALLLTRAAALP